MAPISVSSISVDTTDLLQMSTVSTGGDTPPPPPSFSSSHSPSKPSSLIYHSSPLLALPPIVLHTILSFLPVHVLITSLQLASRDAKALVRQYIARWLLSHVQLHGSLFLSSLGSGGSATNPPVGQIIFCASAVCIDRKLIAFSPLITSKVPPCQNNDAQGPVNTTTIDNNSVDHSCLPPCSCITPEGLEQPITTLPIDAAQTSGWWSLKLDVQPIYSPSFVPSLASNNNNNNNPLPHSLPSTNTTLKHQSSSGYRFKLVDYSNTGPYSDLPQPFDRDTILLQAPRFITSAQRGTLSVAIRETTKPYTDTSSSTLHVDLSPIVIPLDNILRSLSCIKYNTPLPYNSSRSPTTTITSNRHSISSISPSWFIRSHPHSATCISCLISQHANTLFQVLSVDNGSRSSSSRGSTAVSSALSSPEITVEKLCVSSFTPSCLRYQSDRNLDQFLDSGILDTRVSSPSIENSNRTPVLSGPIATSSTSTNTINTSIRPRNHNYPTDLLVRPNKVFDVSVPTIGSRQIGRLAASLRGWTKLSDSQTRHMHSASHL